MYSFHIAPAPPTSLASAAVTTEEMVAVLSAHRTMQRRLGAWCNYHTQLADRLGALHPSCLRAAEACSKAVDAPKSKSALSFPPALPWPKPAWWHSKGRGGGVNEELSSAGSRGVESPQPTRNIPAIPANAVTANQVPHCVNRFRFVLSILSRSSSHRYCNTLPSVPTS